MVEFGSLPVGSMPDLLPELSSALVESKGVGDRDPLPGLLRHPAFGHSIGENGPY
jgi:hypothetical protein